MVTAILLVSSNWGNSLPHNHCTARSCHMAEGVEEVFAELSSLPCEEPEKRDICKRCRRPTVVCVCSCFPDTPIAIKTRVIILQHPNEESRRLATVPLLQECITRDKCHVIRGKRFGVGRHPLLDKALLSDCSCILYPGRQAVDIKSLPAEPIGCHDDAALIVLDGTWAQAKGIFAQNHRLHSVRQVQLSEDVTSQYVVRTQPTRGSLSTLESVAYALAWLEQNPDIVEVLLRPLYSLCQYQLEHGAVPHHSKEDHDYLPREVRARLKKERQALHSGTSPNQLS